MAELPDFTVDPSDEGYIHIKKDDIEDPWSITEEEIRARMEERVYQIFRDRSLKPDLREGSLLYTMLAPAAKELSYLYEEMSVLLSLAFLETTVMDYLDAKGVELGVPRRTAATANGTVRFLGDDPLVDTVDPDAAPVYIPPGTIVTTVSTDPDVTPQQFQINPVGTPTQPVSVPAMSIKATPKPTAELSWGDVEDPDETLEDQTGHRVEAFEMDDRGPNNAWPTGTSGISGNVMYVYTYVTKIGMELINGVVNKDFEEGFGETSPSQRSHILQNLSGDKVRITLPAPPILGGLNYVYKINVYRTLDDTGGDFSEYKLVGSVETDSEELVVWDLMDNVEFTANDMRLDGTNTTGVVDLPASSLNAEREANIGAREIELLEDTIDGVVRVTNPEVFSDALDEETDEEYRDRLLATIKKVPGAGTVQDYIDWSMEIPGIHGVTVIPEWEEKFGFPNGPGTVKVQVSGEQSDRVNSVLVERVRLHIAGDIAVEGPYLYNGAGATPPVAWSRAVEHGESIDFPANKLHVTPVSRDDGELAPGTYQYVYTYVNVGGGETEHNAHVPAAITITKDANGNPIWNGADAHPDESMIAEVVVDGMDNAVEIRNLTPGPSGVSVENTIYRRIYRRRLGDVDDNGVPDERFYLVGVHFNTEPEPTEWIDVTGVPFSRYAPVVNSTSMFNGKAPIGAHITVESISEFSVTITAHIVPDPGFTLTGLPGAINLKPRLSAALGDFFDNISAGSRVYYTDILNAIHDCEGVLDFYDVTVEAPGFEDMTGLGGGSPRFWQLTAGAKIVFNEDGSAYMEELP